MISESSLLRIEPMFEKVVTMLKLLSMVSIHTMAIQESFGQISTIQQMAIVNMIMV